MTKTKSVLKNKKRKKKIIKLSKGYIGRAKKCFKISIAKVEKSFLYSYKDRKIKKRNFKSLWIQRINASTRFYNISYSYFINKIKSLNIFLNKKILSELSIFKPHIFHYLVRKIKQDSLL